MLIGGKKPEGRTGDSGMRKILALLAAGMLALAGINGAIAEEETNMSGTTLKDLGITLQTSYKKESENNPLYTLDNVIITPGLLALAGLGG